MKFFEDSDNATMKMLDILYRYDLSVISYVNNEIKKFNWKLKKIAKLFNHVTILDFFSDRNCFAQHGA